MHIPGTHLQQYRFRFQAGFFLLFVLAPPLDIFRFDLTLGHFIVLGMPWTLGLDAFINGEIGPARATLNIIVRGFLPLLLVGGTLIWTAWRYGRLIKLDPRYWIVTILVAAGFAFLWALSLLTYLLPPFEIYHNLLTVSLTPNQLRFLGIGSGLLFIDFMFARHLFCRFGCAVGLFQSLAWMANPRALVVGFDSTRARSCQDCNNACDNACPMRLRPRTIKRHMFTCTECTQCITACAQVQAGNPVGGLLHWVDGEQAIPVVSGRPVTPRTGEPGY